MGFCHLGHGLRILPFFCGSSEHGLMLRPIVQCRRVKVSPTRPHERMHLRVKLHLGKLLGFTQSAKQFSLQNGREIDAAREAIVERNGQSIGPDLPKAPNTMNWMIHFLNLALRRDRCRTPTLLAGAVAKCEPRSITPQLIPRRSSR